jgi:hypothetical protein
MVEGESTNKSKFNGTAVVSGGNGCEKDKRLVLAEWGKWPNAYDLCLVGTATRSHFSKELDEKTSYSGQRNHPKTTLASSSSGMTCRCEWILCGMIWVGGLVGHGEQKRIWGVFGERMSNSQPAWHQARVSVWVFGARWNGSSRNPLYVIGDQYPTSKWTSCSSVSMLMCE